MDALDATHERWQSVRLELQKEYDLVDVKLGKGLTLADCLSREAVVGMTLDEARAFYRTTQEMLGEYHAVDLFCVLEKSLFADAEERRTDNTLQHHVAISGIMGRSPRVADLIKFWKGQVSAMVASQVAIIDGARGYRNWIAHGKRFPIIPPVPPLDDLHDAIEALMAEIAAF